MDQPLFVIMGATGNVGSVVANTLLARRKRVRVLGRRADRLKPFAARGAETAVGSPDDAAFLGNAFRGASAVFAMVPPNFEAKDFRDHQRKIVEATASGLEAAGVAHAVTLSSVGADLEKGNGPIAGLHEMEVRLARIPGLTVLHLRPGYFMENNLMNVPMMKTQGMNGGPIRGDLPISMIATRDIGSVAATRLAALDFRGVSTLDLMGPRDVTLDEVTRVFGKALGTPDLRYVQFPYEEARKAMLHMGLPEQLAGLYVEMARGLNEGKVKATQPRTKETTTPTTIESFVSAAVTP